jgi:hypothetical protein
MVATSPISGGYLNHWIYFIQERNNWVLKTIRDGQHRLRLEWRYPNRVKKRDW